MSEKQKITNQTKSNLELIVLDLINKQKVVNDQELFRLVQLRTTASDKDIYRCLFQLRYRDKFYSYSKDCNQYTTLKDYVFSIKSFWFWMINLLIITTIVGIFIIPSNQYPITYIRWFLGLMSTFILPGYAVSKALFPIKRPFKISDNLDIPEQIMVSIGLSLSIVPIIGVLLNFSPFGINLLSVTFSLLMFSFIFSLIGVFREYKLKLLTEE